MEKGFGQLKQMEPVQRPLPSTNTVREALQAAVKRERWRAAWAKVRIPSCSEGAGPGLQQLFHLVPVCRSNGISGCFKLNNAQKGAARPFSVPCTTWRPTRSPS